MTVTTNDDDNNNNNNNDDDDDEAVAVGKDCNKHEIVGGFDSFHGNNVLFLPTPLICASTCSPQSRPRLYTTLYTRRSSTSNDLRRRRTTS